MHAVGSASLNGSASSQKSMNVNSLLPATKSANRVRQQTAQCRTASPPWMPRMRSAHRKALAPAQRSPEPTARGEMDSGCVNRKRATASIPVTRARTPASVASPSTGSRNEETPMPSTTKLTPSLTHFFSTPKMTSGAAATPLSAEAAARVRAPEQRTRENRKQPLTCVGGRLLAAGSQGAAHKLQRRNARRRLRKRHRAVNKAGSGAAAPPLLVPAAPRRAAAQALRGGGARRQRRRHERPRGQHGARSARQVGGLQKAPPRSLARSPQEEPPVACAPLQARRSRPQHG